MIKLKRYSSRDIPIELRWQIFSFIRMEWPKAFLATREFLTTEKYNPQHFVFVEDNVLISHVAVLQKTIEHAGQIYKTYGLVAVMTFPSHRYQGYGIQLVIEAKKYIEQTDADIVIFHSDQVGFYEKAGFECVEKVKLIKGDPNNPVPDDQKPFMLFLSEKAKTHRSNFESKPVYFGKEVW